MYWQWSIIATAAVVVSVAPREFRGTTQRAPVSCLASTTNGDVEGLDNGASCSFLGIPYAAPPTLTNRWKPPQPAAAWAPAVRPAKTAAAACPSIQGNGQFGGVEDCLQLNIWVK